MSEVRYRPTTAHDLWLVASDMRQSDQEELIAGGHTDFLEVLKQADELSEWTATLDIDGETAAIFGVAVISGEGEPLQVPWMLGSTVLHRHKRVLLTESAAVVHTLRNEYPCLVNMVYAGSKASVAWLRWLGFTIEAAQPVGPRGEFFHQFHLRS